MLLRKLELNNFRQFISKQEVTFSTDPNKNVTVIMGENGSGKTSLAQSFIWCLYGTTDFVDKFMLNKQVAGKMMPNTREEVRVDLHLTHNGVDYTLTRRQNYRKNVNGKVSSEQTIFDVAYKKKSQQEFLQHPETISRRDEILPKELSKYFFFDGERINNMSKEIQKGRSKEFGTAVRGLLGLNAFLTTIDHLKPTSKYSVIGSYNHSFDSSSNAQISGLSTKIDELQDRLNSIDERLNEISDEIELAEDKCTDLKIIIKENSDSEKLQEEKERLESKILKLDRSILSRKKDISRNFNNNAHKYFARPLINTAVELLSSTGEIDKGVDDIKDTTIKFLIDRKLCICGTKVEFGNEAYENLHELLKYVPPQSIGTSIRQFTDESNIRLENGGDMFDEITNQFSVLKEHEEDSISAKEKIEIINKSLEGMENISARQRELMNYENVLNRLRSEESSLNIKKGELGRDGDTLKADRSKLALRDEKNRKIEIYKAYASYMYDYLRLEYKKSEDIVRKKLEKYINEVFSSIYQGGLSLTVDDKYSIQVIVDDFDDFNTDVETSTAQSISVIFAFIAGIIKIARENKASSTENQLLESEPYPLVMDAPLSAFDKRRIKTVCDALPVVAEQVIIFIKDTDGDIAEANMGEKIGSKYIFEKVNEFVTNLIGRQ